MFDSNQFFGGGGAAGFYPLTIDQSLRFNDDDSAYLSRTPTGTSGGRTTFTYSGWVKVSEFSTSDGFYLLTAPHISNQNGSLLYINPDNRIKGQFRTYSTGTQGAVDASFASSMLVRDPSAWYHIVFAYDSTAAETSRMKLWVNGVSQSFNSVDWPSASNLQYIGSNNNHLIGRWLGSSHANTNGYMANVHFIDGNAYTADAFGELKSGIWVAKAPSVDYGTNGFHLDFANSADIGNDISGNGNDWTPNNFTASDVVLDSPTDNFATLNPLGSNNISSFSQGNLQTTTGSGASSSGATMGMSSGKWYAEFVCTAKTSVNFGIALIKADTFDGDNQPDEGNNVGYFWLNNANIYHGFASDSYGSSFNVGDIMGVAFDADTLAIQFYINNSGQGNYTRVASEHTAGDAWIFGCGEGQGGATATFVANFGQDSSFAGNKTAQGNTDENGRGDFYYAPPSGYLALCTANLPDPVIDPTQGASPEDYFGTLLWTGDGTSNQSVTGLNFQPDLVFSKGRNIAFGGVMLDAVRGSDAALFTPFTNAETTTDTNWNTLTFQSGGFNTGSGVGFNNNTSTFVAWNWKANGSGVSNTDGTTTGAVTVSANQTAGFSIVKYVGQHSTGGACTIGHGLNAVPSMIIAKQTSGGANDWPVYHAGEGAGKFCKLNGTPAFVSESTVWNNTTPTTSVFSVGSGNLANNNGQDYIAYVFAEVEGFSKFGKYNDAVIGSDYQNTSPFVYLGFAPAFLMIKGTSAGREWVMYDKGRKVYNPRYEYLRANSAGTEQTGDPTNHDLDFLSNGFKIRGGSGDINTTGESYIYMAFAENPFKYSNAR